MTENEIHARLQHMVGSSDGSVLPNLSTSPYSSKVLKKGEQVYYADLRQWKTGDGATTIANLPFDKAIPSEHNHDTVYQKIDGSNATASGVSAAINKLSVGTSTPEDADYYVAQYAGGGTTTTTYHRRPLSALWNYIKSKADSLYAKITHTHNFSDITSRGESWLEWGGRNFVDGASPVDAAIAPFLGANRTAFVPASDVTVEYSRDNGSTWTDYGASDNDKTYLFTLPRAAWFSVGKSTSTNVATSDCLLRVVLTSTNIYAEIRKFIILASTNGSSGCWCTIEGRTVADFDANNDVWSTLDNRATIGGWSGYNVINTTNFRLYYGSNYSMYFKQIRFTFGVTSHNSSYSGLQISNISCFGVNAWSFPSNMAKNGMLYAFDASQNARFPQNITSTKFITSGGTSAQFVKGDGSLDATTYATTAHTHSKDDVGLGDVVNLNQSKAIKSITRSGTTFTATALDGTTTTFTQQDNNTTYSNATTSASGLMSAADKAKLNGIEAEANKTVVDTAMSSTSTNPVQNKVVAAALEGKADVNHGNHVPVTQTANNKVFLRNDNTWATVTPENIGAAATSHSHSDYVTVATTQTISGKKTMSGGMAFTNSLPVNNSMRYFLGIDAFSQGGTVKYADASKMCGMIGAMPVLSAASGITLSGNMLSILPETEGNYIYIVSVPSTSEFYIRITGLNMMPGYNLRLILKGSSTATDIVFTRPDNDGSNEIHYPSVGVGSNKTVVLDLCVYDGTSGKEMVILQSAELATI